MVTRINGFSSGMDIDTLVRDMMKVQRMPLEKLQSQRQILEWQRDDYRSFNTKFMAFRDLSFNMKLQSTYMTKTATVDQESIVSVKAAPGAAAGSYELKINSLATAASTKSNGAVSAASAQAKLGGTGGLGLAADTQLTIRGEKGAVTIDVKTTDTIEQFVAKVNGATDKTGVKLSYESSLKHFFATSTTTGDAAAIDFQTSSATLLDDVLGFTLEPPATGQTITGSRVYSGLSAAIDNTLTSAQTVRFEYDGETFEMAIDGSTTIQQLRDKFNASDIATKKGVVAQYDTTANQLVFFNPDDSKALTFTDTDGATGGDMVSQLGLDSAVPVDGIAYSRVLANGTNASVTYNGAPGSFASNTFTIGEMTFTAKKAQAPADAAVKVTIGQDTDKVFDAIKKYVDEYNKLIDEMNTKVSQRRDRDYGPLTDEQKEAMEEKDIEKWEAKAKEGLLRNDSILTSALYQMRGAWSDPVSGLGEGMIKQLAQIGITTGLYSEKGKLNIDEAKLREAIANNPEQVTELFTASDGDDKVTSADGLATRLHQHAENVLDSLLEKAGVTATVLNEFEIGKSLLDINKRVTNLERKLIDIEDRYYRQFTAMEKAIAQMNSQSSSIASMFAGGQ